MVCRCLYYKHNVDMCAAYGQHGHPIQERTVLVGYACDRHSQYQQHQVPSSDGYSDSGYEGASHGSAHRHSRRTRRDRPPASLDMGLKPDNVGARAEPTGISMKEDRKTIGQDSEMMMKLREESEKERETMKAEDGDDALSQSPKDKNVDNLLTACFDEEILPPASIEDPGATDDLTHLDPLRSRLLDSTAYFTSLSELEQNIWLNSSLSTQKSETRNIELANGTQSEIASFVPYPEISSHLLEYSLDLPEPMSDDNVTSLCLGLAAFKALSLLRECRNIAMRTYLNLRRLQLAGFCGNQFSMIVAEKHRRNIARLVMVEISHITDLLKNLESWLQDSAKRVRNLEVPSAQIVTELVSGMMVGGFQDLLLSLDVFPRLCTDHPDKNPLSLVWLYVCMLDVGVVSYAGAHLNGIPSEYYPNDEAGVYFRSPLLQSGESKSLGLAARRCSLQCLNEFHDGKPVWIFSAHNWSPSGRLYLSTTMTAFADIWGPLWKERDQKEPNKFATYIVGNGSIHPWKHDQMRDPPLEQELFCHWVDDEAWDEDVGSLLPSNVDQRLFNGLEDLLIGAPALETGAPTLETGAFNINDNCRLSISKARQRLRDMGRLCILGAERQYRYNSGSQYQLQVGFSGVNASATKQYKRNPGQTHKKALVELWSMEPGFRNPRILTDLHGVEVSPCTHNARRVSLAYLLGLNCMRSLLASYSWKTEHYQTEHFATLKDPSRETRQMDATFREQFGQAVTLCLKMLSKTGVDRKENFSVFLSSECTPKPELATLVSTEHTWIGLLKDTTTDCAMAAFGDHCFEFKYAGATCGGNGRSVFLTAIVPNGLAEPLPLTKTRRLDPTRVGVEFGSWAWDWNVEKLRVGEGIWLGERGMLRLRSHLKDGVLATEWRPSGLKTAMKMLVGKEYPHREYTEVDQSGEESVRPIPVVVISDRARASAKDGTIFMATLTSNLAPTINKDQPLINSHLSRGARR
jgi:hypothetical protein